MQIVVPMAGLGQRFRDVGYTLPKPLIPIDGIPMVVRVVRELPPASKVVFVVHPQHVAEFAIDEVLRREVPNAEIVIAPGLTEGQACSVRLAAPHLEMNESVAVASCDNSHLYDLKAFDRLTQDPQVEMLIWTYRGEPRVLVKPEWYGWVQADETGRVQGVSCKKAISTTPLCDHVVSGAFWFRSARLMIEGIDALVSSNRRINNEFYLDNVPNLLIEQGHGVRVFEVDKYIGWGTPDDVADYQRWARYLGNRRAA